MSLSNHQSVVVSLDSDLTVVPVALEAKGLLETLQSLDNGLLLDVRNPANLSRSLRLSH